MVVEWGLYGLFISCFLAATILPLSSEAVFILLLSLGYSPVACLVVATIGNSLGGITNLLIGRFGRHYLTKKKKTPWKDQLLERYGYWLAFFSWVPFIGDPLLIALGFYRTAMAPTLLLMIAGKAARYLVTWYIFSLTQ